MCARQKGTKAQVGTRVCGHNSARGHRWMQVGSLHPCAPLCPLLLTSALPCFHPSHLVKRSLLYLTHQPTSILPATPPRMQEDEHARTMFQCSHHL